MKPYKHRNEWRNNQFKLLSSFCAVKEILAVLKWINLSSSTWYGDHPERFSFRNATDFCFPGW